MRLGSVPNLNSDKQAALFARDESFRIKFENKRRNIISLNQPLVMLAKMAANGIRTHARTNQRRTLTSRSRQFKYDTEAFIPREKGCLLDCLDWVGYRTEARTLMLALSGEVYFFDIAEAKRSINFS